MEPHNQEVEIIPQRVGHGLNCRGGWGREIFATLRLNNFYLVPCCASHIGPEKKGFQLLVDERLVLNVLNHWTWGSHATQYCPLFSFPREGMKTKLLEAICLDHRKKRETLAFSCFQAQNPEDSRMQPGYNYSLTYTFLASSLRFPCAALITFHHLIFLVWLLSQWPPPSLDYVFWHVRDLLCFVSQPHPQFLAW